MCGECVYVFRAPQGFVCSAFGLTDTIGLTMKEDHPVPSEMCPFTNREVMFLLVRAYDEVRALYSEDRHEQDTCNGSLHETANRLRKRIGFEEIP